LAFNPAAKGRYALAARALVQGHYPSEWGLAKIVAAAAGSGTESFSLKLSKTGTGIGLVQDSAAGSLCDESCVEASPAFPAGTHLNLSATASPGSVFTGWSGACSGTASCVLDLDKNKTVEAKFQLLPSAEFSLSFSSQTNAPRKTFIYSELKTLENLNAPQKLSISGGSYSLNGKKYTSKPASVKNGDTLKIRVKSAVKFGVEKQAIVNIGSYTAAFSVTTANKS
jgi:hypothetical protein